MALKDRELTAGRPCKVLSLVAVMTKEDLETLAEWVAEKKPVTSITRALSEEYPTHKVVRDTLITHLRGRCGCEDGGRFKGSWR